ncbi:hypothetical protein PNEG_00059 [Pneumocystis murina B123]|uniref:Endonuclease III homolog n=1 Tax=Pneumocystis murina (strain B123) TaxID=1069680 RepID=M7PCI8_PNEMU|nr:hypothetical protein PNEG_00059 [Pneumocystis murina B123]EMR11620.1 hypothetical protein PNEG_00059 [Pneumocystis murina B123]
MTQRSYCASKNTTKKTVINFLRKNTRNRFPNGIQKMKEQGRSDAVKKLETDILLHSRIDYNENTSESSPKYWKVVYNEIKKMRETIASNAPVDTMGCDVAADKDVDTSRLQTLISLMLSSQTKDTANYIAMKTLKQKLPGGLTLKSLIEVDENLLNDYIRPVGFHNRKTKYIKETVKILEKDYNGDIPSTIEDLVALPGVGLKMAHLCLSSAWNKTEGIGVDVHVHRISNLLGWVNTKTPEQTRLKLESWLPKKYWKEINHLFVGFGQTICLPRGRKCSQCTLSSQNLCPSSIKEKNILSKNLYEKDTENMNNTSNLENIINKYKIIDVEDLA